MATLSDLQAHLAVLEAARGAGVRRVTYDGRSVEYNSLSEIETAIRSVNGQIDVLNAAATTKAVQVYSTKGWES